MIWEIDRNHATVGWFVVVAVLVDVVGLAITTRWLKLRVSFFRPRPLSWPIVQALDAR